MPIIPTLDHAVVNVHTRMNEAAAIYRRLGFTLTPRGHHSLGSINHLAMFGTDYLELIGLPASATGRQDLLTWPLGLNGLVWGSEDSTATHAALVEAAIPCFPPGEFTRPVALDAGPQDATFRTVRLPNETTPAGRLYFCHHLTRNLVWRDEWRSHPNGTIGIATATIAATDPARLATLFRRMFGDAAVRAITGGHRLAVALTNVDIITHDEVARRYGPAAPARDDRPEAMVALTLRTTSLAQAAHAIHADGTISDATRLLVPATSTFGVTLEFING